MKKIILGVILSVFVGTNAFAASVDTFGIGPRATALGGAVSASSGDVYSIYYNPAALSQLKGGQLSMAIQMADPNLEFSGYTVTGGKTLSGTTLPDMGPTSIKDASDNLYVPFLGYAQPITSNLAFGVAAYVPFGLDVEWDKNPAVNPGAYNWFHSYYVRETVTPTLSYKVNDKFSVGVGVPLGKSKSGAEKILNYPVAPSQANALFTGLDTYTPDNAATAYTRVYDYYLNTLSQPEAVATAAATQGAASYTGLALTHAVNGSRLELELEDSFNYSANLGFLYTPTDQVSLGLTYRGRAEADFSGDVTINGVKVTTADMSYDHPEQVQVGVMIKPVSNVSVEMDVVWTKWSINSTQVTEFSSPLLGILPSETLERDWSDTNQIRLGVEWTVNDLLTLRSGYFYDPSPVPDDTFDIMWPDADRKTYSIGAGFNFGQWTLDTSVQFAYAETKRIIGGESDNINDPYNAPGLTGYTVETSAGGYLMGYGMSLTYNF
ncbi:MAG: outer membrane protein transport protein [Proteobacteria bacterium]|nr:outer membrane protein transport protein [Pseudomonadota bacterium]